MFCVFDKSQKHQSSVPDFRIHNPKTTFPKSHSSSLLTDRHKDIIQYNKSMTVTLRLFQGKTTTPSFTANSFHRIFSRLQQTFTNSSAHQPVAQNFYFTTFTTDIYRMSSINLLNRQATLLAQHQQMPSKDLKRIPRITVPPHSSNGKTHAGYLY